MSSLVTQMIVADRYGPRLSVEQLSECLGISKGAVYNQVSAGTFPVPTRTWMGESDGRTSGTSLNTWTSAVWLRGRLARSSGLGPTSQA